MAMKYNQTLRSFAYTLIISITYLQTKPTTPLLTH